jgi:ClpP class serine protease
MEWLNLIWIVLILLTIIPIIRQRMIQAARRRMLRQLEKQRGSRVITLIHRQNMLSLFGVPLMRYIGLQDSEQVLRAIKLTSDETPIDLILHTPGGLVLAAEQIALALSRHPARVTVFVPHYAMSGGTMVALAADEIIMDANAVLGPVDPQVGSQPAASLLKVLEQKDLNEIDDQTLVMADVARKAMAQVRHTLTRLLSQRMEQERAEAMAGVLSGGLWTHDHPIGVIEAQDLGLSVSTDVPQEVYTLLALHPGAGERPAVEYIPRRYPPDERDRSGTI